MGRPKYLHQDDGPEADGFDRWQAKIAAATKAAGGTLRRCSCLAITAEAVCPRCGAQLAEPEPDHAQQLRDLHGAKPTPWFPPRACARCGTAYQPKSSTQEYCRPCQAIRASEIDAAAKARAKGQGTPTRLCRTIGCKRRFTPKAGNHEYCWACSVANKHSQRSETVRKQREAAQCRK